MRLKSRAPETPQFVSFEEWQSLKRSTTKKVSRRGIVVVGLAVLAAALAWTVPPYLRGRTLALAAAALESAPTVHIHAETSDQKPVFDFWADGKRTSLTRSMDGFRYVSTGDRAAAIGPDFAVWQSPAAMPSNIRAELVRTFRAFSSWSRRHDVTGLGKRTIGGRHANGLVLHDGPTRTSVWLDDETSAPLQCTKGFESSEGWKDVWTAQVRTGEKAPDSLWDLSHVEPAESLRSTVATISPDVERRIPFENGSIVVRSLELSNNGTLFMLVDLPGRQMGSEGGSWDVSVTDSLGQTYVQPAVLRQLTDRNVRSPHIPIDLWTFAFVPQLPPTPFEPVTITVHFTHTDPPSVNRAPPYSVYVEKRFEVAGRRPAPPYLYLDRPVETVNRRAAIAQDVTTMRYIGDELGVQFSDRSLDIDVLSLQIVSSMEDLLQLNVDYVPQDVFEGLSQRLRSRIDKVHVDARMGVTDHRFMFDNYNELFLAEVDGT